MDVSPLRYCPLFFVPVFNSSTPQPSVCQVTVTDTSMDTKGTHGDQVVRGVYARVAGWIARIPSATGSADGAARST